jgi:D-alanine-D-alanine ligase
VRKIETRFGWPCFIKPACSGSSVGTSKVNHPDALKAAILSALRWSERALLEAFVEAREIECAVLGNDKPVAFPPGEVCPPMNFMTMRRSKRSQRALLLIPAPLSEETRIGS